MKKAQSIQEIANRIREERKSQGLSQKELASLAGVSLNFLSQLEMAKPTVRLDKVVQVLETLGLEVHIQYNPAGENL